MPGSMDPRDDDLDRRETVAADRVALVDYAERRLICDATGEPLNPAESVAMTVEIAPGVSTFAMVTAAHWHAGEGELSASDPRVHPDILDGRLLFERDLRPGSSRPAQQSRRRQCQAPARRLTLPGSTSRSADDTQK